MRIALVDDETILLDKLCKLIHKELDMLADPVNMVHTYTSSRAFLDAWQAESYDLILLDIYLDEMTGIQLAQKIRETDKHVRIVFCTYSNDFAAETYAVNATDYLQKPVTAERISQLFHKLNLKQLELTRAIRLPDGHSILLRDILYTSYSDHIVTIYSKREEPYRVRMSSTEIETLLSPYGYFYAPIKGIVLNFHEVRRLLDDSFLMTDGKTLPIARRKYKSAKETFVHFTFEKLREEVDSQ